MKKSFTFLKVSCVAVLLSIMWISEGLAQGLRTSYFMDNVPARLKMNPALQPARGYRCHRVICFFQQIEYR